MEAETSLEAKALAAVRRYSMFERGATVVVSASGGPDSTALLLFLHDLAGELSLDLKAFHLDHMLRGSESEADAGYVASLCETLGVPLRSERADVGAEGGSGESPQEVARRVRLELLGEYSDEAGADRITTGHTADDQVETFLMRIIQGTGLTGLSSIAPVSGRYVRPLIGVWRSEVEQYLAGRGVEARTDSSNLQTRYLRNKVRLLLVPLLTREFGPGVREVILREVDSLAVDREYLQSMVEEAFEGAATVGEREVRLDADAVAGLPLSLERGIVREAWNRLLPDETNMSFKHVSEVVSKVITGKTGGRVELPRGVSVEREYDEVVFRLDGEPLSFESRKLEVPGETGIRETGVVIRASIAPPGSVAFTRDPDVEFARPDIPTPLEVRPPLEGDRFRPLGGGGTRKLSDFFTDIKLPRRMRPLCPVLLSGGEVVWVAGHRLDERFRVEDAAGAAIRLELLRDSTQV